VEETLAKTGWLIALILTALLKINFNFCNFETFLESLFELKFGLIKPVLPK
jgi:hypothetical protein